MGSRGFFSRTSPMRDKRRGRHNRMTVLDEEVYEGLADFRTCEFLGSHSLSIIRSGGIIPSDVGWNVERSECFGGKLLCVKAEVDSV